MREATTTSKEGVEIKEGKSFSHQVSVVQEAQPSLTSKRDHEENEVSNRQKTEYMRATSSSVELKSTSVSKTKKTKES